MLSIEGWFFAIANTTKVFFDIIAGFYYFHKAKVYQVKLLYYAGFALITATLSFLPGTIEFIYILYTGSNLSFDATIIIFKWFWAPIGLSALNYVAITLNLPNRKRYFFVTYLILCLIFEIILFYDPFSIVLIDIPSTPGENLTNIRFNLYSLAFFIVLYLELSLLIFGFGIMIKGMKLKGKIRKKYFLLSLSFILCVFFAYIITTSKPGILSGFYMFGFFSLVLLLYYGVKPIREKREKKKKKKLPSDEELRLVSYVLKKTNSDKVIKEQILKDKELEDKKYIFMSYATKDVDTFKVHDIAKKLIEYPELENVLYWEEHMEDNIFEYMDKSLEKCDTMILFCSENAKNSVPVKKEWTAAEAIGMPIIPVFYDVNHIPTLLKSRLGLEFDFYNMDKNIREIRNLIHRKVGKLAG
ncbi:MAG: toll/interleukin-1 receptor domain-containing protein [Candidatus Lokiarchaeota archaeon]|nr:toll/interleukin-1 receptor domain-containing protein [Candidatus Lokiarchaeota archaeon]